ncbi:MAG: hypothetical protein M3Z03_05580 [Actinomycetota bacterium]|nr:hypothetical protein [Actinomycetota bacterium]
MRKAMVTLVALAAILLGSLTAGSPTVTDSTATSIAGIEFGTPAHHAARVEAALPQLLSPAALVRLLVQAIAATVVVLVVVAVAPLRSHLGVPLAAGRRGPPSSDS